MVAVSALDVGNCLRGAQDFSISYLELYALTPTRYEIQRVACGKAGDILYLSGDIEREFEWHIDDRDERSNHGNRFIAEIVTQHQTIDFLKNAIATMKRADEFDKNFDESLGFIFNPPPIGPREVEMLFEFVHNKIPLEKTFGPSLTRSVLSDALRGKRMLTQIQTSILFGLAVQAQFAAHWPAMNRSREIEVPLFVSKEASLIGAPNFGDDRIWNASLMIVGAMIGCLEKKKLRFKGLDSDNVRAAADYFGPIVM
ncbi:MAG: hypothetical protein ING69_10600 [Rhodocyclaceae bacterium]|nr:hypothetical protein [Rhodocyclaceae bacterium]